MQKIKDKENRLDENLQAQLIQLVKSGITDTSITNFYESLRDANEKKKIKSWLNGKIAFSGDGLKTLNSNRQHPINAVKVLYAKEAKTDALKEIPRGYINTGNNYGLLVLQKNNVKEFISISFFDAVQWVTKQFNTDKRNNYQFPSFFDKKIEYINCIIIQSFKKQNPNFKNHEVLFMLQQDSLVSFTHPKSKQESIYRVVKITGDKCYFTPHNFARHIIYKQPIKIEKTIKGKIEWEDSFKLIEEYDSEKNCSQFYFDEDQISYLKNYQKNKLLRQGGKEVEPLSFKGIRIQEFCVPLNVDRLGFIK
jgi:hypothetical protein